MLLICIVFRCFSICQHFVLARQQVLFALALPLPLRPCPSVPPAPPALALAALPLRPSPRPVCDSVALLCLFDRSSRSVTAPSGSCTLKYFLILYLHIFHSDCGTNRCPPASLDDGGSSPHVKRPWAFHLCRKLGCQARQPVV